MFICRTVGLFFVGTHRFWFWFDSLHETANAIPCDVRSWRAVIVDGCAVLPCFVSVTAYLFCSRTKLPLTKVTVDS